jgi:hypothetical protein
VTPGFSIRQSRDLAPEVGPGEAQYPQILILFQCDLNVGPLTCVVMAREAGASSAL